MSVGSGQAAPLTVSLDRPRLDRRLAILLAALASVALVGWSVYVRTRGFSEAYWIDEGLSIGIAKHGLLDIPGILREDGSPPLYYLLLHFWVGIFGTHEHATHALSLVFSTLTIPAGLWAGWSLFGRRAGIVTAVVCAGNPFLTGYAQETRMYSLVVLWSLLCAACFLHVFVFRRRSYLPWFALTLAALLYTHLWSAFFAIGAAATVGWLALLRADERRELLRDGLLGFAGAALLYLPWIPTALYQLRHTGAPWAEGPTWRAAQQIPHALLGGWREITITAVIAAVGIAFAWRVRKQDDQRAAWVALGFLATMVALAWTISNLSHVWVPRYFAIFLGPLLLSIGWAFSRAGLIGLAGLIALSGFWFYPHKPERLYRKSNVLFVARDGAQRGLGRGDLVLSTHPEQIPLIYHYMRQFGVNGARYATELGYVNDTQIMDWRDGVDRLERTRASRDLTPLLDALPTGHRLYLIRPIVSREKEWRAPWTSLVKRRSLQWVHAVERDPRMKRVVISNAFLQVGHRNGAVQGRLYVKTRG